MPAFIDVSELHHLAAELGHVGPEGARMAQVAMRATGVRMEADMKALAPVDTGALRNSVSTTEEPFALEIGPTMNYGLFQEFGTSRMAPHPFVGPGFDRNVDGFVNALGMIAGVALGGR